jgi:hypothetical protein
VINAIGLKRESALSLGLLVCIGILAPLLFKQQLVVGTIVNATIIGASLGYGLVGGLLVGVLPSTVALLSGLLPAPLMPMVPFILMANSLLAFTVASLGRRNYLAATALGATIKSGLLWAASAFVLTGLLHRTVAPPVAAMMAWPQLLTATLGGIAAFATARVLRSENR